MSVVELSEQCKLCCEIVEISLMNIPSGLCCRCYQQTKKQKTINIDKTIEEVLQNLKNKSHN